MIHDPQVEFIQNNNRKMINLCSSFAVAGFASFWLSL